MRQISVIFLLCASLAFGQEKNWDDLISQIFKQDNNQSNQNVNNGATIPTPVPVQEATLNTGEEFVSTSTTVEGLLTTSGTGDSGGAKTDGDDNVCTSCATVAQDASLTSNISNPCEIGECVPYYLCLNGSVITSGEGILDVRIGADDDPQPERHPCPDFFDTCCSLKSDTIVDTTVKSPLGKPDKCGIRNKKDIDEIKCSCDMTCTFWCIECQEFICDICAAAHKRIKMTMKHQIEEIEQLTKCNCSDEICSWCMDCMQFICKICVDAHQRIKICKSHQMFSIGKNALKSICGEINQKQQALEDVRVAVEEESKKIDAGNPSDPTSDEKVKSPNGALKSLGGEEIQKQTSGKGGPVVGGDNKRSISWINSGKTFTIPADLWDKVYHNNTISTQNYTYYKNKIGDLFDAKWRCILILTHKNVGKKVITLTGRCKHKECRRYKLICTKKYHLGEGATFVVKYSKEEINHVEQLTKQLRGASLTEYSKELQTKKPATFQIDKIIEMDENLLESGNAGGYKSDDVIKKVRSKKILSQDYAKNDYDDMMSLQKETNEDGDKYISKVISPYAVYVHSKEQYYVVLEMHKRRENVEIVAYLDATGGVVYVTPTTSDHPILYYPLIVLIKGDKDDKTGVAFPVTESINSGHGVPEIAGWLYDFNESFKRDHPTITPIFDRIISDFSYANFHGVLHAFQNMSIHQYLYVCYRFCVRLVDYTELKRIVKIHMCSTHLSNTFAEFVRKLFPQKSNKKKPKATVVQKYVIEVFCAMMSCKSYNVLKEIFRNLCTLFLSKFETNQVVNAKENIANICTTEVLSTITDELKTKYKYDNVMQCDLDVMSECDAVYDYQESILKLPIYKGSCFYKDLKFICDSFDPEEEEENESETSNKPNESNETPNKSNETPNKSKESNETPNKSKESNETPNKSNETPNKSKESNETPIKSNETPNQFYNTKILDDFLVQFGGILPLWTGLTVPKGVDKYNNQPAETAMNVAKRLLDEHSLQIGTGKVKATRFIKLMRRRVIGCSKRYLMKLRRGRLNHGKKKPKPKKDVDDSKVTKKIAVHMKKSATKPTSTSEKELVLPTLEEDLLNLSPSIEAINLSASESSSAHDSPSSSLKHSKESWGGKKKKKKFSYFQKQSIISRAKEPPKVQKPSSKIEPIIAPADLVKVQKSAPGKVQNSDKAAQIKDSAGKSSSSMIEPVNAPADSVKVQKRKNPSSKTIQNSQNCGIDNSSEKTKPVKVKKTVVRPKKKVLFKTGLVKDVSHYIQLQQTYSYVVAKIRDNKLTISDYRTLLRGSDLSIECMNYIVDFIVPRKFKNLTLFANKIMDGGDCFQFSIMNKISFIPYYRNHWVLYVINTKENAYCYMNPIDNGSDTDDFDFEFLSKFITSYNSNSNHKNKLKIFEHWKKVQFEDIVKTKQVFDSGLHVIDYVHQFATTRKVQLNPNFDIEKYREEIQLECLEYSDFMQSVCLKCGERDDDSVTEKIDWNGCKICGRWIHKLCCEGERNDKCKLCEDSQLEHEMATV